MLRMAVRAGCVVVVAVLGWVCSLPFAVQSILESASDMMACNPLLKVPAELPV